MTTFNFKKETKVHIVKGNNRYILDVYPDLTATQTFNETSVPVKTLHSQYNVFENAVINRANPANFNFTVPILLESDMDILLDLLLSWDPNSTEATLNSADLYIVSNSEVYKLEKAVMESGIIQIVKDSILLMSLSGSASKLSRWTTAIPNTLTPRSTNSTYTIPTSLEVTIDGVVQSAVTAVNIEIVNNVRWLDFAHIHNGINVSEASGTQFPGAFVVSGKSLHGSVQQYITSSNNSGVNSWKNGVPLRVRVGNLGSNWTLDVNIPSVVFTNRLSIEETFLQTYDYRMTYNPSSLNEIVVKRSI